MKGDIDVTKDDTCTMCEEAPATTTFGAPVCQPCADWLASMQGELKAMEAADPDLAAKGRAVEEAFAPFAMPDRIAIDGKGYGWRVWNDEPHWSMVPVNPDNSPIPQPVTYFIREPDHTASNAAVESAVQQAIEEWAAIAGGPHEDQGEPVTLAHYVTSALLWRFGK